MRSPLEGSLTERPGSSSHIRLATVAVVSFGVFLPLITLGGIAVDPVAFTGGRSGPPVVVVAAIATACYLPLQGWLVWLGTRDARPRGRGWALAVVAVVLIGMLPVAGVRWLGALASLAALVLVVLRPPWSMLLFVGLVAGQAPLALALGHPEQAVYYVLTSLLVGASLAVPVWLVRAASQLQAARLALAREAVVGERLRIDGELQRTVGAALEAVAATGDRANALAATDPSAAGAELRGLVDTSRRTLARARQLLSGYQEVSLRAELETAATLLAAAGIDAQLDLSSVDPTEVGDQEGRAALRRDLARLLRDDAAQRAGVVLIRDSGQPRLKLRSAQTDSSTSEVSA